MALDSRVQITSGRLEVACFSKQLGGLSLKLIVINHSQGIGLLHCKSLELVPLAQSLPQAWV